jgi:hypothetical protein
MPSITLHDVAASTYPAGVECSHCMRRALLTAEKVNARYGDMRKLEDAGLYCGGCGARKFDATLFQSQSRMHAFMRNV